MRSRRSRTSFSHSEGPDTIMFLIPLSSRKPSRPYDAAIRFLQVVRPSRIFWDRHPWWPWFLFFYFSLEVHSLAGLKLSFASTSLAVARGRAADTHCFRRFSPYWPHRSSLWSAGFFSRFTGCEALRTVNHELEAVGILRAVGAVFSASWVSRCLDRSAPRRPHRR